MPSDSVQQVKQLSKESVTYLPWGGTPRTFRAIIERQPTQIQVLTGTTFPENSLQVTFPKDASDGVQTIQKGKDRIRFKLRLSDALESEFTVAAILQEDPGLVPNDGGMFTVMVK